MTVRRTFLRAALLVPLGLAACDLFGPKTCTLIGCLSGLTIHLAAQPTGPYRVEVSEWGPGHTPVHVYDCPGGNCGQDLRFSAFFPYRAVVSVTTEAGVRLMEFESIEYEELQPNGPDCGPTCRLATLTVELP